MTTTEAEASEEARELVRRYTFALVDAIEEPGDDLTPEHDQKTSKALEDLRTYIASLEARVEECRRIVDNDRRTAMQKVVRVRQVLDSEEG